MKTMVAGASWLTAVALSMVSVHAMAGEQVAPLCLKI
jgi:hypothetical protein